MGRNNIRALYCQGNVKILNSIQKILGNEFQSYCVFNVLLMVNRIY